MATPSWYESLPEVMSEAEYRALPEDVAGSIEVVHGHVIKCESPAMQHNRIARRLAGSLEAARPISGPCLSVETDIDVVLWRVPKFTFRRPDVVVYRCLDDPGQKPDASQTLAVVEVSSPGTVREDLTDKRTQYAAAGIPLYLLILLDEKYEILEVKEFHLDAVASEYRLHRVHQADLELELPIRVTIPFLVLTAP
ncbi:Uma2 family endonuclease [Nonomuraea sp. NPDC049784]|uniref:Uma2 family endonuclease n=1 Tax=Nonomuraea sp. NPDC049784 TaxID=3154361 RepID=UPI0033D84C5A